MSNIYTKFRGIEKVAQRFTLSKRFDEPTYFSFRLVFSDNGDQIYNVANDYSNYDVMPHPLFNLDKLVVPAGIYGSNMNTIDNPISYSSIRYLQDANEPTRAEMLREFVSKFNDLQTNYSYYFQQIDGISELLKIDPTKGQRILNDKKITITCLEGLDLRMSYLMTLYRKIAWDDVYQRWVLPDMMRYFTLKIYLAEFRTFHTPNNIDGYGNDFTPISAPNAPNITKDPNQLIRPRQYTPTVDMPSNKNISLSTPLYLKILDNVLPTWEITCEMCEFDITDINYEHLNGLNVGTDPPQGSVKFGIKIGNIKELQLYPTFQHMFISDRKLNAINRAKDEITTTQDASSKNSNAYVYPTILQIAQNRDAASDSNQHISGAPYIQNTNESDKIKNAIYPIKAAPNNSEATSLDEPIFDPQLGTPTKRPNSTQPQTWVGNALDFGTSYAKNFVNKVVDKATMMEIPGLGLSINEITAAVQSKDIISALGLIRKGVNEVVTQYENSPSSRLEQPIQTDNIMRQFLVEITKSEATDKDTMTLINAANIVLSDKGTWEKIKDYSLATDMIGFGSGEVNTAKSLQGTDQYKNAVLSEASFKPTLQVGQIIEAQPSTSMFKKLESETLIQPEVSEATNSKLQ
jgi:hypothetical protein